MLVCGDLVQSAANDRAWDDFRRVRDQLVVPCYCAAGNHDVGNVPTAASLAHYRERIGPDYYTVHHRGMTLVVANSQLWKSPLAGESERHDAWFRRALAEADRGNRPVVVVAH